MARAYIGLGSNLGDRAESLKRALQALSALPTTRWLRSSPVYETEPVGVLDQPPFLNAVAEIETTLDPEALLAVCKRIEATLGREPGPRWGPRVIDLDILLYDSVRVASDRLSIPHPELWNRLFVLVPLKDLRSDLQAPTGESIDQRIEALGIAGQKMPRRRSPPDQPDCTSATAMQRPSPRRRTHAQQS